MNTLPEIPEDILMRAGRFLDVHAGVRDPRRLVALAFMQSEQPRQCRLGLTPQQRAALDFIQKYEEQHRVAPTFDEIRVGLGLASKSGVHRLVHALTERGALEFLPNRSRTATVRRAA